MAGARKVGSARFGLFCTTFKFAVQDLTKLVRSRIILCVTKFISAHMSVYHESESPRTYQSYHFLFRR